MWKELLCLDSLIVLGNKDLPRLPVCSFVVPFMAWPTDQSSERKLLVHHNFIATLLNDLFGIQCRAGCACAGPYAMDLLGLPEKLAIEYGREIMGRKLDPKLDTPYTEGHCKEILRPGFVRFSLPYFLNLEEVLFVLEAVKFVCQHGWVFLPVYKMDFKTGTFVQCRWNPLDNRQWLSNIDFTKSTRKQSFANEPQRNNQFRHYLAEAHRLLNQIHTQIKNGSIDSVDNTTTLGAKFHKMRWFLLPCEVVAVIRGTISTLAEKNSVISPFWPQSDGQSFRDSISTDSSIVTVASEPLMRYHYSGIFEPHMWPFTDNQSNHSEIKMPKTRTIQLCKNKTDKRIVDSKMQRWKASLTRNQENGWVNPLPDLFKSFLSGVKQFDMLKPGDKVLLCLSGGKDSLALLHCLRQYQIVLRREHCKQTQISSAQMIQMTDLDPNFGTFSLGAVTIDPGSSSYDPSPLIGYLNSLGVPYFYEQQGIIKQAANLPYQCSSICSFCSRMKRGRIYATARKAGYNVIAMGQHLDDLVESFFMAAFHQGALNTMKANYVIKAKDLRVIRPLVFVREWQTRKFAEMANSPVIPENCPACFSAPKERMRIKRLLAEQETLFPRLYDNLRNTLIPLLHNDKALGLNAQQNAAFAMTKLLKTTSSDRAIHFDLCSDSDTEN
ncbi:hypothetical protein Ciccas_000504 [Cichlidogyrus casuarinus]|uniref:tRNA(Ile)-lysidine/2-thiocytidine synthase N-terminal domain-containing protein n=1 Tax=Cichlidogyrus casuarinus TaxID=1844966 RepID=A0ABD2QMP5_9PLAT